MSRKCNHKHKDGNSAITDGVCEICKEEFNLKFIKKQRDKQKRKKKKNLNLNFDI